ncbi:Os10g0580750, partial [Oryza sativa Japonica Group]
MDHYPGVGHGESLALCATTKDYRSSGTSYAQSNSGNICPHELHYIIDGHCCAEREAGIIDEEADVRVGVDGVEEEELADDCVGEEVLYLVAEEDDALPEEEAHDVTPGSGSGRVGRLSSDAGLPQRSRGGGSRARGVETGEPEGARWRDNAQASLLRGAESGRRHRHRRRRGEGGSGTRTRSRH